MTKRLWDKGEDLNEAIHHFTVGDDPVVDGELLPWDLIASAAHARMLSEIGLISSAECHRLLESLQEIARLHERGEFHVPMELEDCHTAIENYLITKLGDAGRKIHTGRSRNDQVLVMVRLYLRDQLLQTVRELYHTAELLLERANTFGHLPLPGYTHFQPAMPASVKMWLAAFAEQTLALGAEGKALISTLDSNPLGAASGFYVPLPLDRARTTSLLGFSQVQRNPIYVQNTRGQFELKALRFASDIGTMFEKFAWDLILYSSHEFGIFSLPTALTTGSSIMPQKRNPDVAELLRARTAKLRGAEQELLWVIAKMPSNYHRDFQYTKEPLVRGFRHLRECLSVFQEIARSFTVNESAADRLMTDDLYVTYEVYRAVRAGKPFRDAYLETAQQIKTGTVNTASVKGDFAMIAQTIDREVLEAEQELATKRRELSAIETRVHAAIAAVFTSEAE